MIARLGRRGFALLAALWLLVALSALSLGFGLWSREQRLVARNLIDQARATAAARAGVQTALGKLDRLLVDTRMITAHSSSDAGRDPWANAPLLEPDSVMLGAEGEGARYSVVLRDAGEALNLNHCSADELRRLLVALRVDAGLADRISQAVLDWRDADDLRRARGAEQQDYARSGGGRKPRNRPFATLSELQWVMGVTPELYEKLAPFLTLLGSGHVNLNRAPRPVLLSLPGMTESSVAILLGRHNDIHNLNDLLARLPSGPRTILLDSLSQLTPRVTFETDEVIIRSAGRVDGGAVRAWVEALVVRTGTTAHLVRQQRI
jgi:general secretion pathway protein K